MVSLLTAFCDNDFLPLFLTSSFISAVALQLYFEHTAWNIECVLSLLALWQDIRIPANMRNPLKELVSTASIKLSCFLALQDYFCLGRAVYCFIAIFKDITEKALIPSHKTDPMQRIHIRLITFITVSLDLWPCRFLGDWLSIEHMMTVILSEKLPNFLFLGPAVLFSFYQIDNPSAQTEPSTWKVTSTPALLYTSEENTLFLLA